MKKEGSPFVRRLHRREFLQGAALSGTASLLSLAVESEAGGSPSRVAAAGKTDALLLTCMDYRFTDFIVRYMASRDLREKYDHVVLAGASLGAITKKFPHWNRTFWDHLDLAIKLHKIRKVMILDHRKCGAYDLIL